MSKATTRIDKKGRATSSKQPGWPSGTESWSELPKKKPALGKMATATKVARASNALGLLTYSADLNAGESARLAEMDKKGRARVAAAAKRSGPTSRPKLSPKRK